MKALFPISLNNQRFSTENVVVAYNSISSEYDNITFVIADQLQLYNKALRVNKEYSVSNVLYDFRKKTNYFEERKIWLERLRIKVNNSNLRTWEIISIDDIVEDATTFTIFRNILVAYYSDEIFSNDIKHFANNFAIKKNTNYSFDKVLQLSIGYLLEEIALSIKLKVVNKIFDEFYLGDYAYPILKLFNGEYDFTVFDIADLEKPKNFKNFKFYSLNSENKKWDSNK